MRKIFLIGGLLSVLATALAAVANVVTPLTTHTFLDKFRKKDSSSYNYFVLYNPLRHNPAFNTFRATKYHGKTVFFPKMRRNEADVWLYDKGQTLGVGGSIAIRFLVAPNNHGAVGLALSPRLTQAGANGGVTFSVQDIGGVYSWDVPKGIQSRMAGIQTGLSTLGMAEPSPGTYVATVTGGGLAGSLTLKAAFSAAYFGMFQFSNMRAQGQVETDLCSPAPSISAAATLSPVDPAALMPAIMLAYQSGRGKIIIPRGVYRLPKPTGPYYLTLTDMKDFRIIGNGVTLLRTDPLKGGISFVRCRNVTLTGVTLRCSPLPYTQGRIIDMHPKWLDFRINKGYPVDLENPLEFAGTKWGSLYGDVFSARTLDWKPGTGDVGFNHVRRIGPRSFRLAFSGYSGTINVGDLLKFNGTIHRDIRLQACNHMRISRVTILGGTGFGVLEVSGEGDNRYDHLTIAPPPKPRGANVSPLVANNADGFHSVGVRHGPTLTDCYFDRTDDDGIAIHGIFSMVQRGAGKLLIARCPTRIRPMDRIEIFDGYGGYVGQARVVRSTLIADYKPKHHITHRRRYQIFTGHGPFYRLRLTKALPAHFEDYISDIDANGSGFVIRNCVIQNNRAHGILVKADYGVIEGCTLDNNTMAGIDVRPMPYYWAESGCSSHILILNNTIKHVGYFNVGAGTFGAGALSVIGHTDTKGTKFGHTDIQIVGNRFVDDDGINLLLTDCRNIMVVGNTFVRPMRRPNNRGANFHFGTSSLIWLQQCKNLLLSGNDVVSPGPAMKKLVAVGPDTSNVIGKKGGVSVGAGARLVAPLAKGQ